MMKISAFEDDNRLYYQITDVGGALEKAVAAHGYTKADGAYAKSFPPGFPYRDKIVSNFLRNAETVFNEEASSGPVKWREGFEHFASIAHKAGLDWWTTGKILLPLNGIDAEIDDVDFYFRRDDLSKIYEVFSDYIIEPVLGDTWRSKAFEYYGLAYAHCTICLLVEPRPELDNSEPVHFGPYAANHLITVKWQGLDVRVPPIELYIKTLKRWGKHEFAEFIINALKGNDTGAVPYKK